jgi:hypothetical protein
MPQGTQTEVLPPGTNEKPYWAGAGDSRPGVVHYGGGPRQTNGLFRDLLDILERRYASRRDERL